MQTAPFRSPKNAPWDQYKIDLLEEEIKGGLKGSPLLNSYIGTEITSYAH